MRLLICDEPTSLDIYGSLIRLQPGAYLSTLVKWLDRIFQPIEVCSSFKGQGK